MTDDTEVPFARYHFMSGVERIPLPTTRYRRLEWFVSLNGLWWGCTPSDYC